MTPLTPSRTLLASIGLLVALLAAGGCCLRARDDRDDITHGYPIAKHHRHDYRTPTRTVTPTGQPEDNQV